MQTNDEEQKENEKNKTCVVKISSEDEKLKKESSLFDGFLHDSTLKLTLLTILNITINLLHWPYNIFFSLFSLLCVGVRSDFFNNQTKDAKNYQIYWFLSTLPIESHAVRSKKSIDDGDRARECCSPPFTCHLLINSKAKVE